MLRTFQPKKLHRKKEHGFRKQKKIVLLICAPLSGVWQRPPQVVF